MKPTLRNLILTLTVCLVAAACSKKQFNTIPNSPTNVEAYCTQVVVNEPHFTTLNISKATLELSLNQQNWKLYSSIRFKTDSALLISLQPLAGFEAFRIECFPQYIRVIDKLKRRYAEIDYSSLSSYSPIPISFELLQSIFKRQLFVIGRNLNQYTYANLFMLEQSTDSHTLTSSSGDGKILHKITLNTNLNITQVLLSMYLEGSSVEISYPNTQKFKSVAYPSDIHLAAHSGNNYAQMLLHISRASFDEELNTAPTNLYRYERTTLKQLFQN